VGRYKEVAKIDREAFTELAVNFSTGLFGIGYFADIVIHPSRPTPQAKLTRQAPAI